MLHYTIYTYNNMWEALLLEKSWDNNRAHFGESPAISENVKFLNLGILDSQGPFLVE